MKGAMRPFGYTIVELMIVLAISGVMFAIAASFISGKQESSSFTEGTTEFTAELQAVISQVTSGQYSDRQFDCQSDSAGVLSFSTGSTDQGSNAPCVFLGKFLYFPRGTTPAAYELFSLAGNRLTPAGAPATTLGELNPTPIVGTGVDLTQQLTIPQNLSVKSLSITAGGTTYPDKYGFGFIQSAGSLGGGVYNDGGQTIGLVYSNTSNLDNPNLAETTAVSAITGSIGNADSATLCLSDGQRTAKVTVGDNGASQLSANLQVTPC